jgi:chromosome segregation ATPase
MFFVFSFTFCGEGKDNNDNKNGEVKQGSDDIGKEITDNTNDVTDDKDKENETDIEKETELKTLVPAPTSISGTIINKSQDDIKLVKEENELLKTQTKELEDKIKSLEKEIDELKNGAQILLAEAQDAFNNKKYAIVESKYKVLTERHAGSNEAIEAHKLVELVNEIKANEEKKAKEEQERLLAEQQKNAMGKAREIIRVKSVLTGKPNSAGGVNLYIVWQNKSQKTIKYAYFTVEAYNAVDDVVYSNIGFERKSFTGKETGPVKTGEWRGDDTYWECAWYNNTIVRAVIKYINIEYMDGTTVSLNEEEAKLIRY